MTKNKVSLVTKSMNNPSAAEIEEWLVNYLAKVLETDPDEIDPAIPFEQYGLDSAAGITMTGDLDEWLGRTIDPSILYDYPTIESLVAHLTA